MVRYVVSLITILLWDLVLGSLNSVKVVRGKLV